jgi:hypothetical protein
MQAFTSANTSVNRSRLPAVYGRATFPSSMVMDYGCGKYIDHIREHVHSLHKAYLPYDPFNQSERENASTVTLVCNAMYLHVPVDVVCSNVLNVIDSDGEVSRICHYLEQIASATGGTAFVTVYEGDRSCVGRQTGKDSYQRNAPLSDYLRFFHHATIRNNMIIIKGGN